MKKKTKAILMCLFLSTLFSNNITQAQERLISLKPNISEIIFALGLGEKLVGVTEFCKKPPKAKELPKVADYTKVYLEKVLQLKPDLVLASPENSSRKEIESLINRGIQVELLDFKSIAKIQSSVLSLGEILNQEAKAKALIQNMKKQLKALQKQQAQNPSKKALIVVGYRPLVVVGEGNFIHESLSYLNLKNVTIGSGKTYPVWDLERVLASGAEIIIDLSMGSEKTSPKILEQRKAFWQRLKTLPAVKNNQIIFFDIEKIRAVPSLTKALKELAALVRKP